MKAQLIGFLLCTAGIALASWIYFGFEWQSASTEQKKLVHELFTFSLTSFVVGGAALFYGASQRMIEAQTSNRQRLETFHVEWTAAYNEIKYIRRELRNALRESEDGSYMIEAQRYASLLRELNRGQLRMEQFRRMLESKPSYLSFFGECGVNWVATAENYLRKVTREYEKRELCRASEAHNLLLVRQESKLFQFVAARKADGYDSSSNTELFGPLDKFFSRLNLSADVQD